MGPNKKSVGSLQAIPTITHMAFVQLMEAGLLKYVVSQNTDGMHRRSGIHPEQLAELHGNTNLEKCRRCGKEYMRDFRTRNNKKVHEHATGRRCDDPDCQGELRDTIINFGEHLDEDVINRGFAQGEASDLCLAMGSSLRVTPAADIPKRVGRRRDSHLVIVNLQETPLDGLADLRINAMCDTVMQKLMQTLQIPVPEFKLVRRVGFSRQANPAGLKVMGLDSDGCPFSLFPKVEFKAGNKNSESKKEPHLLKGVTAGPVKTTLHFLGNYGEPPVVIDEVVDQLPENSRKIYRMVFNPRSTTWEEVTPI